MNYKYRQTTTAIRATDAKGTPLADQDIRVKLVNNEFLFGCGAFDFLPATAKEEPGKINFYQDKVMPGREFYLERTDLFSDLFNYGTLPFYWGGIEPTEGQVLTESRMTAARAMKERGIKVKGHPLCWHTVCADWLMDYDNPTILQKQIDRIYREVTAFKGVIDMWDVINEVVIMPVYDRYDNAITRICKDLGRIKLAKEVFEAAHDANPDAVLLINDFDLSESYRILIDGILNAGIPVSAIGLQSHQHQGYMGLEKLNDVLERYSVFGLPLHFTENTLVSGELMPKHIVDLNDYQVDEWPSTPEGEERQCREWKEMYETLFAHPLVEAVTGWDLADGAWLHAPSGIIREDNTPKSAYYELKKLIKEEWTTDLTLHTDGNGVAEFTGFRGDYEASAGARRAEFKLTKADERKSGALLNISFTER